MDGFLADLGIRVDGFSPEALWQAAQEWQQYLRRRGSQIECTCCSSRFPVSCACGAMVSRRQHIITDFLVGGHALADADLLLTRDAGYFKTHFPQLRLAAP